MTISWVVVMLTSIGVQLDTPKLTQEVYVFADLVLDFGRRAEGKSDGTHLTNCSNAQYFCVDGHIINFVVPRTCQAVKVGDHWSLADIKTTVISDALAPQSHGSLAYGMRRKAFYLQSDGDADTVYLYQPDQGIKAVYHDRRRRTDFALLARQGKLDQFFEDDGTLEAHARQHLVKQLITFDTLAECKKTG